MNAWVRGAPRRSSLNIIHEYFYFDKGKKQVVRQMLEPQVGVEPTTSAFWFVPVSWLPGLSLHPGLRFRWQPSSLYTRLTRNRKSVLIMTNDFELTWLGITLETVMNCLNCGAKTTNPKFCRSSCAAR
jgi:hypothetical protein